MADDRAASGVAEPPRTFADRLKLALNGESISALARKSGVGESLIRKYLSGTEPGIEKAASLADSLGVSLQWLATGTGPEPQSQATGPSPGLAKVMQEWKDDSLRLKRHSAEALRDDGFVLVPRYNIQASAGPGLLHDREDVQDWLAFKGAWVRLELKADPRHLVLVSGVGESMEPTIRSGDLLLVDTSVNAIHEDAIYVLATDGGVIVKRVQRFFRGAITVKSDNPAYVEETFGPEDADRLRVAGRVRWIGRLV